VTNYSIAPAPPTPVNFTIDKLAADVVPLPNSKLFGTPDPIPLTTGTVTGFLPADGITVTYKRDNTGENAGPYVISYSIADPNLKLQNYSIPVPAKTAVFTILKATQTVDIKVNDTYTTQGATPTFSNVATPAGTVTRVDYQVFNSSNPTVPISPINNLPAGTYTVKINPLTVVFATNVNYTYTLGQVTFGTLVVNATGNLKPIRVILDCITVVDPATNGGFGFVANFRYTNDNSTDYYIPAGSADNKITPSGSFVDASKLPSLFKTGGGKVKIPFDGTKITWYVSSFDKNKKTASTSEASSTSGRCPNNIAPSVNRSSVSTIDALTVTGQDKAYPNPVQSRVYVESDFSSVTEKDIRIIDLQGRELRAASVRKISATRMEVDMSNLIGGQYYIRFTNKAGTMKMFRIIKQ